MKNSAGKNYLAMANGLFLSGEYRQAKSFYRKACAVNPAMAAHLKINIELCERKSKSILVPAEEKDLHENKVFLGIAAIPERVKSLEMTIHSLIDQVPKIGVYLNGWKSVPDFLKNEKIELAGYKEKDIGDIGKFHWVDSHDGVYFTCDDDLIYPADYVKRTLAKMEEYNYNAVVGWHGSIILDNFQNYYDKSSRKVFVFSSYRPYDTPVHILGTGCSAFHTDTLKIKKKDFLHPNMADIFFSLKGQEQKIPFVVLQHEKGEIIEAEGSKESSIYFHSHAGFATKKNTAEFQNSYVKSMSPWKINPTGKLSVLLIGRFETYKKGGIYKSCHLIKEHLISLGHKVRILDTTKKLNDDLMHGCDLCWIYPGDPDRPDFESVDSKIEKLSSYGVPVLVNLSYLYKDNRTKWIADKVKSYNSKGKAPVMAAVFTESAAHDPIFEEVRDYICTVPKTIDPTPYDIQPKYEEREGICLGDATKLANNEIIGGSIGEWIDEIHKRLPNVNLYAYKQYQGKNPHPKVTYVSHMDENFGDWLAHRKIFVCMNVHLTFEMVACEAQQYGTPTLYRHMPHSLSEYISSTGIAVRTPEEMGEMVSWLYNNKNVWNKLSRASHYNACSKHINVLDSSLEGYLKLAIVRAKRIMSES